MFLFAHELGHYENNIDLSIDESKIDAKTLYSWIRGREDRMDALWKKLVPSDGGADTLQGEVVRALGNIRTEYRRNGNINWGDVYYKSLAKIIKESLKGDDKFSPIAKRVIDIDVAAMMASGRVGRKIAKGELPVLAIFGGSFLTGSDVEESHARLAMLISVWCDRNPELIPY